jgi:hypothetical protein
MTGVSGGAVVSPATSVSGTAKRPGDDTGNGAAVVSYNVTSSVPRPDASALDPITITGLSGAFDFYWGSIDSYNIVDFYLGNAFVTYTGTDAFLATGASGSTKNFGTDGYLLSPVILTRWYQAAQMMWPLRSPAQYRSQALWPCWVSALPASALRAVAKLPETVERLTGLES